MNELFEAYNYTRLMCGDGSCYGTTRGNGRSPHVDSYGNGSGGGDFGEHPHNEVDFCRFTFVHLCILIAIHVEVY